MDVAGLLSALFIASDRQTDAAPVRRGLGRMVVGRPVLVRLKVVRGRTAGVEAGRAGRVVGEQKPASPAWRHGHAGAAIGGKTAFARPSKRLRQLDRLFEGT